MYTAACLSSVTTIITRFPHQGKWFLLFTLTPLDQRVRI